MSYGAMLILYRKIRGNLSAKVETKDTCLLIVRIGDVK